MLLPGLMAGRVVVCVSWRTCQFNYVDVCFLFWMCCAFGSRFAYYCVCVLWVEMCALHTRVVVCLRVSRAGA